MSDIVRETAIAMPSLSLKYLESLAETVVATFQPEALSTPQPIRVPEWMDLLLPRFGIHVMPASYEELGEHVAATYPSGESESEILVSPWIYDNLHDEERPHFARATVIHELAHAILHVPVLRHRLGTSPGTAANMPVDRHRLTESSDPEWQAWALAGAILMPRRTIAMLPDPSRRSISDAFFVSEKFAAVRLERLARVYGEEPIASAIQGVVECCHGRNSEIALPKLPKPAAS